MMLSEVLMIVFLIWFGITFAGMYWARHTKMFDNDVTEAPETPQTKDSAAKAKPIDLQAIDFDKALHRINAIEVKFASMQTQVADMQQASEKQFASMQHALHRQYQTIKLMYLATMILCAFTVVVITIFLR